MFAANLATVVLTHIPAVAAWVFQEGGMPTDPLGLWKAMGLVAKTVVIILFIMSGWSIGVMIDRAMAYNAARKQSRAFAPAVPGALGDGRFGGGRWRYRRSAGNHGYRAARSHPCRHDVQLLDRPGRSLRRGDGQLLERADRLLLEAARCSTDLVGASCLHREHRVAFRRRGQPPSPAS